MVRTCTFKGGGGEETNKKCLRRNLLEDFHSKEVDGRMKLRQLRTREVDGCAVRRGHTKNFVTVLFVIYLRSPSEAQNS